MLKIAAVSTGCLMAVALVTAPALAGDRYGAIASDGSRAYGYATNYKKKSSAERTAIQECEKRAGSGTCAVRVWFTTCGAVTRKFTQETWGIGDTEADALAEAKSKDPSETTVFSQASICNG
jgi:hypothetical protein